MRKGKFILAAILFLSLFLRLWKIGTVPVSLFGDEVDIGYQAYSFLRTGRDYFGNFMPSYFQSFADARAPLYIYSAVPTVAIWGISPLGVRLPAVIFGGLGVLAIYLLVKELLSDEKIALVSAIILALSPWHIQYSRAAFEVTLLLFFLILGLYFLLRAKKEGGYLWMGVLCLSITPWIYSTAKLFAPLMLTVTFFIYRKEFFKLSKKHLTYALVPLVVFGLLLTHSFVFGEGAQRFSYISIFTDPTTKTEVEYAILSDAKVRNMTGGGLLSRVNSRVMHNTLTFWGERFVNNIFRTFSTDFLFVKGDLNLRHSIEGMGQFYKVEIIALILGILSFFVLSKKTDAKSFIVAWLVLGIIPSAITRDGGDHATRLIIILPVLVLMVSFGLVRGFAWAFGKKVRWAWFAYGLLFLFCLFRYQHYYWMHNPFYSERWWHSAYENVVRAAKDRESEYEKIVISNADDNPLIFFAGYAYYDPMKWQSGYKEDLLEGFGNTKHYGKYHFGQVRAEVGIEGLGEIMDEGVLYIASEREVGINLAMQPEKKPEGLDLVDVVYYPSGEPAFYLFERSEK